MKHWTYFVYELAWALPVIAVQWAAAGRELWRWRRLLAAGVVIATLYLGACDAFALGHGIWRVDPARVVGVYAGSLPLEEFVFYFVTNIMAAQGVRHDCGVSCANVAGGMGRAAGAGLPVDFIQCS